jgi:ankyrin repeat protein
MPAIRIGKNNTGSRKLQLKPLVNLMRELHFFRQFRVAIALLLPLLLSGATFAGAADDEDVNADFIKAAFSGNVQEVERLLGKGADVNTKRDNGMTALIGASLGGHDDVVKLLLAKGADVDAKVFFFGRSNGATAYDLASQAGHQEIVKLLVRAGAYHEEKAELYQAKKAVPADLNPTSRNKRN